MSAPTLRFHHALYARYVRGVNSTVDVGELGEAIELATARCDQRLREQAQQALNHAEFFAAMVAPGEQAQPGPRLAQALQRGLGTKRRGVDAWARAAESVFGSGWVWLVAERSGAVRIVTTKDSDRPAPELAPLLVMDVWEHAYYLDYPIERGAFAESWLRHLAHWARASALYDAAVLR
jgi:Fe-Mn family superoxide dismutase